MHKSLRKIFAAVRAAARSPTKSTGRDIAKSPPSTQISSSWTAVKARLRQLHAKKIALHGDQQSFATASVQFGEIEITWLSIALSDFQSGAKHPEDVDWAQFDAVVCAGQDLATRYRQSLRLMLGSDSARPVLWVGGGFEFCGGTVTAPADASRVEGLLFNHFLEFFGVKDPLQFRIEVYHGPEVKRYYRILAPNQSHIVRLADHFTEVRYPVCLAVHVEHPLLTRGRHYRLRLCADVFWRDSLTTMHSSHEFNRSPDHKVEFRIPAWLVRSGDVVLTIPNFDRNVSVDSNIEAVTPGDVQISRRSSQHYVEQSALHRNHIKDDQFFGWRYRGYGGSNWFAMEDSDALTFGHRGSISGNHHISCPIQDRTDFTANPEELDRYRTVTADGFVLEPHAVPMTLGNGNLIFGFEADSANPRQRFYRVDFFDGDGSHLGFMPITKEMPGPLFPDEIVREWSDPARERARLALISNDWLKAGLRFKGFKPMANLIVRDRHSGDQDVTEFQSCWRNLGTTVPGFPHWLTDQQAVVGRTNVMGRARCDQGLRTGIIIVNGSGRLTYRHSANADIVVLNSAGQRIEAQVSVPAFTWQIIWLEDVLPEMRHHLGSAGNGALLVQSGEADLNCQIVTTTPKRAVSIQHLWGY